MSEHTDASHPPRSTHEVSKPSEILEGALSLPEVVVTRFATHAARGARPGGFRVDVLSAGTEQETRTLQSKGTRAFNGSFIAGPGRRDLLRAQLPNLTEIGEDKLGMGVIAFEEVDGFTALTLFCADARMSHRPGLTNDVSIVAPSSNADAVGALSQLRDSALEYPDDFVASLAVRFNTPEGESGDEVQPIPTGLHVGAYAVYDAARGSYEVEEIAA